VWSTYGTQGLCGEDTAHKAKEEEEEEEESLLIPYV